MRSALTTAAPILRSSRCGCRLTCLPRTHCPAWVPFGYCCCYLMRLLLSCIAFRLMAAFVLDFDGCRASARNTTRPGPHWSSCRQAKQKVTATAYSWVVPHPAIECSLALPSSSLRLVHHPALMNTAATPSLPFRSLPARRWTASGSSWRRRAMAPRCCGASNWLSIVESSCWRWAAQSDCSLPYIHNLYVCLGSHTAESVLAPHFCRPTMAIAFALCRCQLQCGATSSRSPRLQAAQRCW